MGPRTPRSVRRSLVLEVRRRGRRPSSLHPSIGSNPLLKGVDAAADRGRAMEQRPLPEPAPIESAETEETAVEPHLELLPGLDPIDEPEEEEDDSDGDLA